MKVRPWLALAVGLGACTSEESEPSACADDDGAADPYADCVVDQTTVDGSDYNHDMLPDVVLGPPGGSTDVASLGCGGVITLGFSGIGIVDEPGPDLIVYENPFSVDFPEPGQISVSVDGEVWSTFDCDATTLDGCAGVTPTGSDFDPPDPEGGGDSFDLADVGLDQAHYVRIEDLSDAYWAPLGENYCDPGQQGKGGFDLDAVASVHG